MISDEQLVAMSLSELRELHGKLGQRLQTLAHQEKQNAVNQVRELIASFGIESKDVFGRFAHRSADEGETIKRRVEPKYRNPENGMTWTGRGKAPKWLEGKNRDDFKIEATTTSEVAA